MKFMIVSLPRSGSTAVYRVLSTDRAQQIAYEPGFFDEGTDRLKIVETAARYFEGADGLKHVWDPNGWPFRNKDHISSLDVLSSSQELVPANQAVLECAGRIAFLRRKDAFARTLSDLWAQQTNLWGHNPHRPHDSSEVRKYRAAVRRHVPSAIDPDVFGWYLNHAEAWENAIIDGMRPGLVRTYFYEDLFHPDAAQAGSLRSWRDMAEWLDLKLDFSARAVRKIISPNSKLNSAEIFERIPNFRMLKAKFGRDAE